MKGIVEKEDVKNIGIGALVGLASLVPGVSGGTILVIAQKYDRLLKAVVDLGRGVFTAAELRFMAWLIAGGGLVLLLFPPLMDWLLTYQESVMMALFFGLILGGGRVLARETNLSRLRNLLLALLVFVFTAPLFGYLQSIYQPVSGLQSTAYWIFGGALGAFFWILPGISGSSALIILGLYHPMMEALAQWHWARLFPFGLGMTLGMLAAVWMLNLLFERYRKEAMACLFGLTVAGAWGMLGYLKSPGLIVWALAGFAVSRLVEKTLS